ncbi:MAG: hypothetical protein WCP22_09905 [Chlamydiota bacterium]
MRRAITWFAVALVVCGAAAAGGCKKRYIPRVSEEITDPGVPISQDTVVE